MKKTLFINPCVRPDTPKKIPNVGLAYVMSEAERRGLPFELLDIDANRYSEEEIIKRIQAADFDIAGIGTLVSVYGPVKRLCQIIRDTHPNATIVIGNTLGTSVPNVILNHTAANICVLGEGETTFSDIVESLNADKPLSSIAGIAYKENGQIKETCGRELIPTLDQIPFPNYDLFNMDIYRKASRHHVASPTKLPIPFDQLVAIPINTARGCPFRCNFCYHAFQNKKYRTRTPQNIVKEMLHWKEKYGVNFINFWDELTWASPQDTEAFADALIAADPGMFWIASCRSELLVRREGGARIAKKLKQAGCHGLAFSLESGNPEILAAMNKKNTVQEFIEQCHVCHEAGIDIYTSLIIGYPQETFSSIDDSFAVMKEARIYPSVGFLQLMPGTPMYALGRERGLIQDEEEYLLKMGDRQDLRINLTQFDDQELMDYTVEKLKELNQFLHMGLDEKSLLKTKVWRGKSGDGKRTDNFMEDFGVAGEILRKSNFS